MNTLFLFSTGGCLKKTLKITAAQCVDSSLNGAFNNSKLPRQQFHYQKGTRCQSSLSCWVFHEYVAVTEMWPLTPGVFRVFPWSGRDVLGNVEVMQLDFEMENFTSLSVTRRINWNIDYKGQNPPPDSEKVVTELTVVQRDIQAIIPLAMVSRRHFHSKLKNHFKNLNSHYHLIKISCLIMSSCWTLLNKPKHQKRKACFKLKFSFTFSP